jgi:hypothetical protein
MLHHGTITSGAHHDPQIVRRLSIVPLARESRIQNPYPLQ